MTPEQYSYQKIAPKGSALYFSLRKLPFPARNHIAGIYAFYKEIEDITLNYSDANIAHAKLNWWRDEVIRIQEGTPNHPVALFLRENKKLNLLKLIEIIDGLEQNLTGLHFEKFEDVVVHFMRTAGVRDKLVAAMLQDEKSNSVSEEIILQISLAIELIHYLQNLRQYLRKHLLYFSQDEMQKFQVTESMLYAGKSNDNIRQLLQFQADKAVRAFEKALASLSGQQKQPLEHLILRAKVQLAVLQAIQAEKFSVLENYINITPLRCWWMTFIS